MNIYLAGSFAAQERLREQAKEIEALGHKVTSRWLSEEFGRPFIEYASDDIADIDRADLVIFDLFDKSTTGGRDVEFGYAYAKGKKLWTVGLHYGIFYGFATGQFVDWEAALIALEEAK